MAQTSHASPAPHHPSPSHNDTPGEADNTRRDFLVSTAGALGVAGAALAIWPFVNSMWPAADTLALGTIEVDISKIALGQAITVLWRGKPVFIRHRTPADIEAANVVDISGLRDPATDKERVKKAEWLVMVGVCTHLGCIPGGQKPADSKGEFGGWFCPCHGSQYDTSGRIRKGPAPLNLEIPEYTFLDSNHVKIG